MPSAMDGNFYGIRHTGIHMDMQAMGDLQESYLKLVQLDDRPAHKQLFDPECYTMTCGHQNQDKDDSDVLLNPEFLRNEWE